MRLDFRARDLECFWSLLELSDRDLIDAIGGRARADLHAAYEVWEPADTPTNRDVESLCKHHPAYPKTLRGDALAPHTLGVRGGTRRLADMLDGTVVAVVGARRATDYGMNLAKELARGLASSGLTIAGGLGEGIASAVQTGTLEAHGRPLGMIAGSLMRCAPAWCAPVYRRVVENGCAISEQPASSSPRARAWWHAANDRTLALLADLTIVVEAGEHPRELAGARVAWTRGREVAAVPGRVTSPASKGTNVLLMDGARLVRNTQDALDALYGVGARVAKEEKLEAPTLEAPLRSVLERVGSGQDTMAKLAASDASAGELALALAELELRGLLVRGDGGRYVRGA
jgi:DNA processing protein